MAKPKKIKVVYKKLGKQKAFGSATIGCNEIEIEERLRGKKHLEILIHEILHLIKPKSPETEIIKESILITNTLWHDGYRKVDNSNYIPLQDGSK